MPRLLPLVVLLLPVLALARAVPAVSVTASTTYPPQDGASYKAANIIDNRVSTVWIEGERSSGLGSWVEVDLGEARPITGLRLWNGNWYTADYWQRHNRMKDIEVLFSDGSKQAFTLKDVRAPETITFPAPVTTSKVKVRFKGVYAGTTFGDTCLSELQVLDATAPAHHVARGVKASTVFPADADASYEPTNLVDDMIDTLWCEGDKKGDGTGQWVEVDLGEPRPVGHLRVWNGNASSPEDNARANQPTGVTLSFDDGSTEALTLAASADAQDLAFPPRTTRTVRVAFTAVAKGTDYNDLCVSEMVFSE